MKFLETSTPLSDSDLKKVEQELNITFPLEFKEHYLKYNGGYPESDTYSWNDGSTTTINTFSSIKYDGFTSLEDIYRNMILLEGYLPTGIIPFANDDGGNMFCISARKEDFGFIYYCNNDHYNTNDKMACLTLLEKSFNGFLDNLSSDRGNVSK